MSDLARARQDHEAALTAEHAALARYNAAWEARMTSDPADPAHQDRIDALAAAEDEYHAASRAHHAASRRLYGAALTDPSTPPEPVEVADPRRLGAQDADP